MTYRAVTRLRGNVLLVAILVAIVLFFLSVAMVTANRQNFIVSAHLDNRFQAEGAARAGANSAIQLMRTDPQWAVKLPHSGGEILTSTYSATASPFPDPQGTNYFWEVYGEGLSDRQIAHHNVLVEQIKMVSSLGNNEEALLFAYTTLGQLAILDATFHWSILGPPPQNGATLAANNGPLFTFGGAGTTAPPVQDWRTIKVQTPQGVVTTIQLLQAIQQTYNNTDHIVYLNLDPSVGQTWMDVPDPGPLLGHSAPPTANGQAVQGAVPPNSTLVGGSQEWYDVVGQGLAANGTTIYCHAEHSFYLGAQVQNSLVQQPGYWRAPAVLSYDIVARKWTIVADGMKVSNLHSVPTLSTSPYPDVRSLGLVNDVPYAYSAQNLSALLEGASSGWQPNGEGGVTLGVYGYNNQVVVHQTVSGASPLGAAVTFDGLTPTTDLTSSLPAVQGLVPTASPGAVQTASTATPVLEPVTLRSARSASYVMWGSDATAATDSANPFQQPPPSYGVLLNSNQPYIAVQGAAGVSIPFTGGKVILNTGNPSVFAVTSSTPSPSPTPVVATGGGGGTASSYGANTVAILNKEFWTVGRLTYSDSGGVPQNFVPGAPTSQPTTQTIDALVHYDGTHWQAWPGDIYAFYSPTSTGTQTTIPYDANNDAISPEHIAVAVYQSATANDSRFIPMAVLK